MVSMLNQRDFAFHELIPKDKRRDLPLFSNANQQLYSDLGGEVFIPSPVKEYPLTHFMRVSDVEQ
jgi:hypothetical protein